MAFFSFSKIDVPSHPTTFGGQSQIPSAELNTVPGLQFITIVAPLTHCKNCVQSEGCGNMPVTNGGHVGVCNVIKSLLTLILESF